MRIDHVAVLVERIESVVEAWGLPTNREKEECPRLLRL